MADPQSSNTQVDDTDEAQAAASTEIDSKTEVQPADGAATAEASSPDSRPETEKGTALIETTLEAENAATKISAVYRGKKVRESTGVELVPEHSDGTGFDVASDAMEGEKGTPEEGMPWLHDAQEDPGDDDKRANGGEEEEAEEEEEEEDDDGEVVDAEGKGEEDEFDQMLEGEPDDLEDFDDHLDQDEGYGDFDMLEAAEVDADEEQVEEDKANLAELFKQAQEEKATFVELNQALQKKVGDQLRTAKKADDSKDVEKSVTDQEQRYYKCLAQVNELRDELKRLQQQHDKSATEMKRRLDDKQGKAEEIKEVSTVLRMLLDVVLSRHRFLLC